MTELFIPQAAEGGLTFTVPGEPASKSRARFTKRGSKVHTYTPEKTKQAESRVSAAFLEKARRKRTDTDIAYAVRATFFHGTLQRRDVDNMLKLVLDGLNGIAWPDDVQVLEVTGRKEFVPKDQARTEVTIQQVGRVPKREAICEGCGKKYPTYESWGEEGNGRRFCNMECYREQQRGLRQRTCQQCGATFEAHSPDSPRKFCSTDCKYEAGRVDVECSHCGQQFSKQKCYVRDSNYCSDACMRSARSTRRKSRMPGTCQSCGAGTTRKEYVRCNPCRIAEESVSGRPKRRRPARPDHPGVTLTITERKP